MKGINMIKVNQETLVEALQRYLDAEMPGHKVRSVNHPGTYVWVIPGEPVSDLVVSFEPQVVEQAHGGAAQ